jgi:uncharacterized protein (TIGR00369 family)
VPDRKDDPAWGLTPFQRSLGLRWAQPPGPELLSLELDLRDDLCGPAGSLEGGVVSTLADVAGASCAAMNLSSQLVATQDMSISFLAPGRIGPIRATAEPLRVGRTNAVVEVRVIDTGKDNRLIAVALLTATVLDRPSNQRRQRPD